jgi:demethylmenaquinone methyltransferase/2-methoxy-6-polyprenyl-1,4-benzoquinol methylase
MIETGQKQVPFGAQDVGEGEKEGLVRGVFDRVANRYDLMNDLMSAGVHRLWKTALIDWLDPQPGQSLIDVAGGTGDVARAFLARANARAARRHVAPARAMVCDINAMMLKAGQRAQDGMPRICGDAERLPFQGSVADVCTIAFGIRNVTHIERALSEMFRVLKPGGRFVCLEFSHVEIPGLDALYDAYSFKVIPQLGKLVANDAEAYRYLVESIRRFPTREKFAGMLGAAGFAQVRVRALSGGIAALHSGWRL